MTNSGDPGPAPSLERAPSHSPTLGGHGKAAKWQVNKVLNKLTDALEKKNTYAYKNIKCDEEIRVLKLYPGVPGSPILCCLIPSALHSPGSPLPRDGIESLDYEALSYYWGTDDPQHGIYIFENHEAYVDWKETDKHERLLPWVGQILIRSNLRDALEQLRSTSEPIYLWADALWYVSFCVLVAPVL